MVKKERLKRIIWILLLAVFLCKFYERAILLMVPCL